MVATALQSGEQPSLATAIVSAVTSVLGSPETLVPLHEPQFSGNEWSYVKECLDTGWVSSVGSFVDRIERDLAAFTGAKHAVATGNGTAALHVCMILAGVQPGDEVLLPTLTFIATANAVYYTGATPHFVDSEAETLGVDAAKLEAHLAKIGRMVDGRCANKDTGATIRALVVMHAFGHPADLNAIGEVCRRWSIILVEDAAESLGSFYHGQHTGNVGQVSALSFNGNKVMTTGGGGAILTNDPALARRAKHLTTTARVPHRWNFIHDEIGFNYRMPNINAALGCAQLEQVPAAIERKRKLADRYARAFAGIQGLRFLREPAGSRSNYWLNTIVLDRADERERDGVLAALNDSLFMSRPLWTLMHRLPMYASCPRAELDVAERLAASVINLPSSAKLAD